MPFLPRGLLPMLPSPVEEPFDSSAHVFELKWDGIRALARVEQARLTLTSRSGRDLTALFPELAGIAAQMTSGGAILDGEIVALDSVGRPDLSLLSRRLAGGGTRDGVTCFYQAYDALYARGEPLLHLPLDARRQALRGLLRPSGPALVVDQVETNGVALFEAAAERRLAGIVAKARKSTYTPGATSLDWLEVPVFESAPFLIGGYALGVGKGEPITGLLLGEGAPGGGLRYAGMVEGNLPSDLLDNVLSGLTTDACPFMAVPAVMRLVYWTRPELVCHVRFGGRTAGGALRFPVFVSLRPDIAAKDLVPRRRAAGMSVR